MAFFDSRTLLNISLLGRVCKVVCDDVFPATLPASLRAIGRVGASLRGGNYWAAVAPSPAATASDPPIARKLAGRVGCRYTTSANIHVSSNQKTPFSSKKEEYVAYIGIDWADGNTLFTRSLQKPAAQIASSAVGLVFRRLDGQK